MDTLMSEASQKCRPTTCVVSPSVISLLELEGGVLPCSLPDGQVTDPCGQGVVLASPSVLRERGLEQQTSGICGLSLQGSSGSVSLQRSLGSRLRARLEGSGSVEYSLTWKEWDIRGQEPICALRASTLRTSGRDCIGWPTPNVDDSKNSGFQSTLRANNKKPFSMFPVTAQMAGWLTPSANEDAAGLPGSKMQAMLGSQVKLADLNGYNSGETPSGIHAETEKQGVLNPAFSLWLMGYPAEWVCCGAQAMQSFRKSRRSS